MRRTLGTGWEYSAPAMVCLVCFIKQTSASLTVQSSPDIHGGGWSLTANPLTRQQTSEQMVQSQYIVSIWGSKKLQTTICQLRQNLMKN